MRARFAAIFVTLATCAVVSLAHGEPSSAQLDQARALFREGNELRDKNDMRGALAKYEAAHALFATPITGLEVGRTHLQLGELLAARDAFVAAVKLPVKPQESANTAAARAEAARLAGEVEARIPKIVVSVESTEPAQIEIDGSVAAQAPRQVDPGKHVVVVRSGSAVRTSEVVLVERETREIKVSFAAPAAPASPALPPAPPAKEPSGRPTWVWVGFGVAGAGVVVGSIAGAMTLHGTSQLSSGCNDGRCPPDQHDRLSSTRTWATVSTISFAVAGTVAAVSLVGLFASSPSSSASQGSITPTVGLGSIGVRGAF
jgi:hypothetical protein